MMMHDEDDAGFQLSVEIVLWPGKDIFTLPNNGADASKSDDYRFRRVKTTQMNGFSAKSINTYL